MTKIMTQVSVHMENRPGALADLTAALTDSGVNILGISVPDTGEFGTVRILANDALDTRAALDEAGMPNTAVDVLVVDLPHRPGALSTMARLLSDAQVVIRYCYSTIPEGSKSALCILQVDDIPAFILSEWEAWYSEARNPCISVENTTCTGPMVMGRRGLPGDMAGSG